MSDAERLLYAEYLIAQKRRARAARQSRRAHVVAENARARAVALAWEAGDDDAFDAPAPDC